MKSLNLQPDLLFCRKCRRHFRGQRRVCPSDGSSLELVTAFVGQAGDVLDERYELVQQVGVGGMGTVFRAEDRLTKRVVALKLLNDEYASNASSAQRFFQEAKLVRLVTHPSVASLHRFGRTREGRLLIDMELVEGESVRDRVLREGRGLDPTLGLMVLDNLLGALAACHDAGVVHCDVKPENVMLPRDGTPGQCKLVDFGIAQAPGPVVQSEDVGVVGTPAYMSPEQIRGLHVDARTDLYLVGCVTYELLTGEPPFLGGNSFELCQHHLSTPPPPLSSRISPELLPRGFEAWLTPLLEKDPDARPTTTHAVRQALRTLRLAHRRELAGEPVERVNLRPPSAPLLRRTPPGMPAVRVDVRRSDFDIAAVHALIEVRQLRAGGMTYGPEALEQIARHVLAGSLGDLREWGAKVSGPAGAHIEVRVPCNGDERGTVCHLLDAIASMHLQLSHIPEPRLELRAALVGHRPSVAGVVEQALDPLVLLRIAAGSQIRVDEHVARWAGRRALVRLTTLPEPRPTQVYATSLHPV
ncbi:MAG: serine/threonine-protein kinase [Myxococcota bacterium]